MTNYAAFLAIALAILGVAGLCAGVINFVKARQLRKFMRELRGRDYR